MMMNGRDKRAARRVPVAQLIIGMSQGNRLVRGNISTGGVGFELEGPLRLRPNDPIAVQFMPEVGEPLVLSAVVTRVEAPKRAYGKVKVGARFVDVDPLVQNPLFRFVEEAALLARAVLGNVPVATA